MGINLGGRDIGVPQHDLHTAQVGPALQQMGGEAMTKHMGRKPVEDAGFPAVGGQELPERLAGEAPAARGYKKVSAGAALEQRAAAVCEIGPTARTAALPTGTRRCLLPLPVVRRTPRSRFTSPTPTLHNFAHPQPGGVQQFHHRAIPQTGRAGHVRARIILSISSKFRNLGIVCHCLGVRRCSVGSTRDFAFPQEKTVEVANRRKMTADGASAEPGLVQIIDMTTDFRGSRQICGIANKFFKTSKIRGIGVQRVGAQALLQTAEVQKGGNLVTQVCRSFRMRSRHRANDTISR
jgi:hypothetical protein